MDDLDSLLQDLGAGGGGGSSTTGAPSQQHVIVSSKDDLDDLDALLNTIGSAPAPTPVSAKSAAPAANTLPVDDLDALMESLGSATPASVAPQQAIGQDDLSELDAILGSTLGSTDNSAPLEDLSELNSLMGNNTTQSGALDDLDDLMKSLDVKPAAPAPSTPTRPVGVGSSPAKSPAAFAPKVAVPTTPSASTTKKAAPTQTYAPPVNANFGKAPPQTYTPPVASNFGKASPAYTPPVNANVGKAPPQAYPPQTFTPNAVPSFPTAAPNSFPFANSVPGAMPGADISHLLSNLNEQMGSVGSGVVSRGICSQCGQKILGEVMQAMGKAYHPEHFLCGGCKKLLGTNFFESNGQPFCETCFQLSYCPRCAACNEPVLDRCVSALGQKWHVEHFSCASCQKPFPSGNFFEKDKKPYCEDCFVGSYAPRCASCNQIIKGSCVNALGKQWHPEHFTCAYCNQPFNGSFFDRNGKPYCQQHYLLADSLGAGGAGAAGLAVCGGCSKPIQTGTPSITALNNKFHQNCLLCGFCMSPLVQGGFKESSGRAFCSGCATKFGIL